MITYRRKCYLCKQEVDIPLELIKHCSIRNPSYVKKTDSHDYDVSLTGHCPLCNQPHFFLGRFAYQKVDKYWTDNKNHPNAKFQPNALFKSENREDKIFCYILKHGGDLTNYCDEKYILSLPSEWKPFDHPSIPELTLQNFKECELMLYSLDSVFNPVAVQCRRVLELICNHLLDNPKGNLKPKIEKLLEQNHISPTLYDWANTIRLESNKATHEEDSWSSEEASEIVAFTKTLLEYVYIMPYKIAELRRTS